MTGVSGLRAHGGEHLETAHHRHAHVAQHDVGVERGDLLDAGATAERRVRREPLVLEQDSERIENSRLVIDHEDGGLASIKHRDQE